MNPGDRQRSGGRPPGGFGASPWTDAGVPPESSGEPVDRRSPFGGDGWSGSPGLATDSGESDPKKDKPAGRRRRSKGPTHTRRTLAALGSSADLYRDANGVAHVYAKTERDAYAALGFCMAEDRLWQMDFLRRRAGGRSAEILGSSAARHDALLRTVGVPRRAAAAASRMDGIGRDVLAAFAGGVNAARAIVKPPECERLGYEIEPWTIADSLAIELYLAWTCSAATWPEKLLVAHTLATAGIEAARAIASRPIDAAAAADERLSLWRRIDMRIVDLVQEPEVGTPAGHVAALGMAGLLSASVELPRMVPSPMYPIVLDAPDFKVAGVAHLGMPALLAGRNESLAWGVTGARADDADCVLEELDGIGGFRSESGWEKLARRREMVRVRDGDTLKLEVAETRHGPLLSHLQEQLDGALEGERPVGLALCWGANSLGTALPGLLAIARSGSTEDVLADASELDRSPLPLEALVADREGTVAHVFGGAVPVRSAAARLPVRGAISEGRWSGIEPLSAGSAKAEGDAAVAVGALGAGGNQGVLEWRGQRWAAMLQNATSTTVLEEAPADVGDMAAEAMLPVVRSALAVPGFETARRILEEWDARAERDSTGAALFYVALAGLPESLFADVRRGRAARCRENALAAVVRALTAAEPRPDRDEAIRAAVRGAQTWLEERLGSDPSLWRWGQVLTRTDAEICPDPETPPSVPQPASGSPFTILGQRSTSERPPFDVDVAEAVRVYADLSAGLLRVVRDGVELVLTLGVRPETERVELVAG